MNTQLTDFVQEALLRGVSREDISRSLLEGGWTLKEINTALDGFVDCGLQLPVPRKRVSGSAKETFLFLMLFSALYTMVFALGSVLFDLINLYLPKPGDVTIRSIGSLRYGIASVVVSFPILLFMHRIITREALRNPGQRISPVRRWLTYLTLFVASVSIVTDLITLIVRFLAGDLTPRFVLKVLVVAVMAGIVLFFYLRDLRRDEVAPSNEYRATKSGKIAYAALIVTILVVICIGFWTAGSPAKARLYEEDNQRITDLTNISRKVELHYLNRGVLPQSLSDCDVNPDTFIKQKNDRVSGDPYKYRVIDSTNFELGANFNLPSLSETPSAGTEAFSGYPGEDPGFWRHGAGLQMFRIDATKVRRR